MFGKIILITILVAVGLVGGAYLGLILIGNYLTPTDPLVKSDVIVILSGGPDRTSWGIKLYQDGWAPKLLLVGAALDPTSISNAAAMKKAAVTSGVPETAIVLEEESKNTLENAEKSRPILTALGAHKIILVTSPYHQRRAYETFRKVLGEGIVIVNSPSGYSDWSAKSWWEQPSSANLTTSEIMKLLWADLTGEYN